MQNYCKNDRLQPPSKVKKKKKTTKKRKKVKGRKTTMTMITKTATIWKKESIRLRTIQPAIKWRTWMKMKSCSKSASSPRKTSTWHSCKR